MSDSLSHRPGRVLVTWPGRPARDAAVACWLTASVPLPGCRPVYLAAPDTLTRHPTEKLLDPFLPGVPRRPPMPGRTVPVDLTVARTLPGFAAEHEITGVV